MRIINTNTLKVGDLWPQRWLQHMGTIVEIRQDGNLTIATFANGMELALGDLIPVEGSRSR